MSTLKYVPHTNRERERSGVSDSCISHTFQGRVTELHIYATMKTKTVNHFTVTVDNMRFPTLISDYSIREKPETHFKIQFI